MSRNLTQKLQVGGGVIFWRLASGSSQSRMAEALNDAGYATLIPQKRRLVACLKDAMDRSCGGGTYLIRPLAKTDGFALIQEKRGTDRQNEYEQIHAAWLEGDDDPQLRQRPSYTDMADKIQTSFRLQQDILRPAQTGNVLTHGIQLFQGTTLRDMGGIYWLPDDKLDRWKAVTEAVESCAVEGKTVCYLLRNVMDEDSVKAVRDAIVSEMEAEAKRVHEEIMTGNLKGRALRGREQHARDLMDKIGVYEQLLSVGLTDLRSQLEQVEQAAAAAALLVAGDMTAA